MAKIALEIGGLNFPSKTAATTYFRQMRDRYQVWLLERHPEFRDKVGVNIDYFSVRRAAGMSRASQSHRKSGRRLRRSSGTDRPPAGGDGERGRATFRVIFLPSCQEPIGG
jgi:hypothetical protein